jgi:hypothetical protein
MCGDARSDGHMSARADRRTAVGARFATVFIRAAKGAADVE